MTFSFGSGCYRNDKTPARAEARVKERTVRDELCVALDGCKTVVVFMHGNGVLATPEVAKRVLPHVAQRPSPGNQEKQDQREHRTVSERVVEGYRTDQSVRNRQDQAYSKPRQCAAI